MFRVATLYPKTESSHFDLDYYLNRHVPLVRDTLSNRGLMRIEIEEGIATISPDQPVPYAVMGHLVFDSIENLQTALKDHAEKLLADVPNFTNVQPVIQINSVRSVAQPIHARL